MEESNGTILLDVDLSAYIKSLQDMQKEYEKTKERIKELTEADGDNAAEIAQLTQQNKVLQQEMRGVEKQMQNEIKANKANEGSLVQLRAQLANLNKQYDQMSGFDRMGTAGIELRDKIKGLSDQITNLEGETGRWQRNVGNYKSALEGLRDGFKGAGLATGGLDKSLKLLNGNPIVLFLTAIVTVVRNIIQAFKGNEEAMMALRQAFSAFNPIIDKAKKGLEALANVIVNVVTSAVSGLTSAIGWLLDAAQNIGNFFGADWHMGDNFREGVVAAQELQQAENDYIKDKRAWSVESAKIDRDVADLREKAAEKDKYNAQQRLAFLDEAIALETKKAAKEKELAEQNLENLQKEAARAANSAEMNDKLAAAERAVIEADKNLSDTKRTLNKQRQAAIKDIAGETAAIKKQTDALRQQLELIKAMTIDESIAEAAKNNKELADNISKVTERVGLLVEEFDKLDPTRFAEFAEVTDENLQDTTTQLELFVESFRANADAIESISQSIGKAFSSIASMYKQMAEDETKSEEERAAAAKKAKTWAGLQIAANAGTALAKGIAGAMDAPTVVGKIAALATVMAAVLSAVAEAKALAADTGYETGGVIGGAHGASMGHDDTVIRARRGEMVLNAQQQKSLLEVANGGTSGGLTASLIAAMRALPNPVLEYSEFVRFQGRVVELNESQQLR